MKTPPEWKAVWLPDYEHNGTTTGIQLYDLKIDGKAATVLCLVGHTGEESIAGEKHHVWIGFPRPRQLDANRGRMETA